MANNNNYHTDAERLQRADEIIKRHIMLSMGSGFIPVPIADVFALSTIQLDMIKKLCTLYDINFSEAQSKAMLSTLVSSSLVRLGARAVKLLPGVGFVLGGITLATISGASTYAIGEVFKKHFQGGGSNMDFDWSIFKNFYDEKFEMGKKIVEKWRQAQQNKMPNTEDAFATDTNINITATKVNIDVISQLKELAALKAAGVLSDAEFEAMKKKLIQSY